MITIVMRRILSKTNYATPKLLRIEGIQSSKGFTLLRRFGNTSMV